MPREKQAKSCCVDTLRHAEYYQMQKCFDHLYAESLVEVAANIYGVDTCVAYCHSTAGSIGSAAFAPLILRNVILKSLRVECRGLRKPLCHIGHLLCREVRYGSFYKCLSRYTCGRHPHRHNNKNRRYQSFHNRCVKVCRKNTIFWTIPATKL